MIALAKILIAMFAIGFGLFFFVDARSGDAAPTPAPAESEPLDDEEDRLPPLTADRS